MKKIYLVTFLLFITSCFSYSVNAKKHRKQVEMLKQKVIYLLNYRSKKKTKAMKFFLMAHRWSNG